ncbi:hypothetical protein ACJMK2_043901 [Sinanodonta woodiana]|uniref:Uncharacterized protein n=1 Tax=Sinanodonta woodiana TaxID=1069815 RepID=A0ABD3W1J1_SINWO
MDFTAFIKLYFYLGLSNSKILCCLAVNHRIVISMRTLKRRLTALRLYRRKYPSNILNVVLYVAEQISESGCQNGYRWMHVYLQNFELLDRTLQLCFRP